MRWFGSKKPEAPAPQPAPVEETESELKNQLTLKEIDIYPLAVKLLWHYYDPQDQGKDEGRAKEFPGPVDDRVNDSVRELEKTALIEVVPTFSDFGITAKLTRLGLLVMAGQPEPGHLAPAEIPDPNTGSLTVYKEVNLQA